MCTAEQRSRARRRASTATGADSSSATACASCCCICGAAMLLKLGMLKQERQLRALGVWQWSFWKRWVSAVAVRPWKTYFDTPRETWSRRWNSSLHRASSPWSPSSVLPNVAGLPGLTTALTAHVSTYRGAWRRCLVHIRLPRAQASLLDLVVPRLDVQRLIQQVDSSNIPDEAKKAFRLFATDLEDSSRIGSDRATGGSCRFRCWGGTETN
eukprot:g29738.t1